MNKKVCIVAPIHIWDDVRVYHKEACSLSKNGWNIYLIAQADKPFTINGVNVIPAKINKKPRWKRFLGLSLVFWQAMKVDAISLPYAQSRYNTRSISFENFRENSCL
jgi:hypothetical protein